MYSKTSLLTGTLYVARDITADIIILVAEPSCSQVHHFVVVVVGPLPPPPKDTKKPSTSALPFPPNAHTVKLHAGLQTRTPKMCCCFLFNEHPHKPQRSVNFRQVVYIGSSGSHFWSYQFLQQTIHDGLLVFFVWPGGRGVKAMFCSLGERKKWLLLNNRTSLGRLGSAALVGRQSRRRISPIRNTRVPGVLDGLDV